MLGKLVDSISSYEILNNMLPGTIYVAMAERYTTLSFRSGDIWSDLVVYYFIGLVIGRIGSLLVEPLLRLCKLLNKDYENYITAELKDNRFKGLSAICNMYRTFVSVFLCLIPTFVFCCCLCMIRDNDCCLWFFRISGSIFLMIIFICSFVKQNKYINERIKAVNSENNER